MAVVAPSSPDTQEPKPAKSEQDNPASTLQEASPLSTPPVTSARPAAAPSPTPENPNPNTAVAPNPHVVPPPPPSIPSFTPSFRPVGAPAMPQFTPLPNPSLPNPGYQGPGLQPPGVSAHPMPPGVYHAAHGQMPAAGPGSYVQTPNGYMAVSTPPSAIPPPAPSFGSW